MEVKCTEIKFIEMIAMSGNPSQKIVGFLSCEY